MGDSNNNKSADSYLVERVLADDQRAFGLLVEKHKGRLSGMVTRMLSSSQVPLHYVEDLVQESFVRAYKGLRGFRGESEFYTWLYQIARRHAINFITRYKKTHAHNVISLDQPEGLSQANGDGARGENLEVANKYRELSVDDPYNELVARQTRESILQCLDELPKELRESLRLCELSNLSYLEIAEITDTNIGTVKSRIHRARKQVFKCLEIERK